MVSQLIFWGSVIFALLLVVGALISLARQPRSVAGRLEEMTLLTAEPPLPVDESQRAFAEVQHLHVFLGSKNVPLETRKELLDPLLPYLITDPLPASPLS
jgi:hypothetical protein